MKRYKQNEIDELAKILKNDGVISVPTDTVYGICACMNSKKAHDNLITVKNRPANKLFPIMCADEEQIKSIAIVDEKAEKLIQKFMPGPITLILKKNPNLPDYINNGKSTIAVRMATSKILENLIRKTGSPLFMTSANQSGEPTCTNLDEIEKSCPLLDGMMEGTVSFEVGSTIVDCTSEEIEILRQGPIITEEIKRTTEKNVNRLKRLISPFVLRRVKKDVLTELPEKNITIMKNEMETEQEKLYLSYLAQTKKEVAEELKDTGFQKSKFKILMLLTRLRQICCHPSLFIENYNGSSGKLKQCIDLVSDAIESEHKILIFSSYTSMFEIIEKELSKLNIQYFKLVGDTPVSKRIEMVDEFNNNPSVKVFLISLKAGGTGLNLTSADVVIHYDPWWNVSSENQATDRAYRIGQKNSVQVYKLITSNSIEEKINKMQERKEKLSKDILSTEETFINKMSKEDILDLFEL